MPLRWRPGAPSPRERKGALKIAATLAAFTLALVTLTAASAQTAPPTNQRLTVAAQKLRERVYRSAPCLARIIDVEDPTWDPTISWHGGHDVNDSYGLPQGNPGTKMARYSYTTRRHRRGEPLAADWATNALTQLAWMLNFATGRYGSPCAAWDHRWRHGSY